MNFRFITILMLVAFSQICFAQSKLQTGFDYLDSQAYSEAKVFFESILQEEPNNLTANICHGRAVGLGGQKQEALQLFETLSVQYPNELEVVLNLAEANMWNENYTTAVELYQGLLEDNPNHFVVNFGYANANAALFNNDVALEYIEKAIDIQPENYSAKNSKKYILISIAYKFYKNGQFKKSQETVNQILEEYPGNPNAIEIQGLIISKTNTVFTAGYNASEDNGQNLSNTRLFAAALNLNERHRTTMNFHLRETQSGFEQNTGAQRTLTLSDKINLGEKADFELGIGSSSLFYKNEQVGNNFIGTANLELFLIPQLYYRVGYKKELHNYNANLIKQQIETHDYSTSFNLMLLKSIGWYSNFSLLTQSDSNNRILWNQSIYFKLSEVPTMKFGINTNYMRYKEDFSELYFSPDKFQSGELFLAVDNAQQAIPFKYNLTFAIGGQQVNDDDSQNVARIDCMISYGFKNGLSLQGQYIYSNAAQMTATGAYNYSEWRVGLSYALKRQFQKS